MHLEEKALLLEPTDEEAPIIHTSCSLFNTFEKQISFPSITTEAASCVTQEIQPFQQQSESTNQSQSLHQKQLQKQQNFVIERSTLQKQRYSGIVEEDEEHEDFENLQLSSDETDSDEYNPSDGDVEYFNDKRSSKTTSTTFNNNCSNKQKSDVLEKSIVPNRTTNQYQRSTSYPHHSVHNSICSGNNRQSSSKQLQQLQQQQPIQNRRRRRTSFIEGFTDISYEKELLRDSSKQLSTNRFRSSCIAAVDDISPFIFGSIAPLNVSIRAQLSPRDIVLKRCQQTDPYDFSTIYSEQNLRHCRKIGEGVYGEVFMNKNDKGEAIVLKIIPIEGQLEINGEVQKNFEQILPEIIIAEELSRLRNDKKSMTGGFVEVKNVHCVQGCYPEHLIDLWELYRDNCGTENDHPEIFPEDQLYIVLELANAGQDLEAFNFQNGLQSYSAFLQVALSLAVAEEKFKFEHRDLHWGNILLSPTDQTEIYFKLNGKDIKIPTHGVKATIIDYTLSRMIFEGCCLYNDLSNDNELFSASGDYQFDIYRFMKKRLDNQWERYEPYTNILWLHYVIDKMISGARYRCSKTKKHRSAIQIMMKLRDELLDYNCASDYVNESFDEQLPIFLSIKNIQK